MLLASHRSRQRWLVDPKSYVMFDTGNKLLNTLPLTLKFPPVIVPVALINPPVNTLPAVMFALTDTVVPVCVVALTLAPPSTLPAVMLPVADINPPVR